MIGQTMSKQLFELSITTIFFAATTFAEFSGNIFANHEPCMDHDHETLRPIIVETWMPEKVGGLAGESLIFAETQVKQTAIYWC